MAERSASPAPSSKPKPKPKPKPRPRAPRCALCVRAPVEGHARERPRTPPPPGRLGRLVESVQADLARAGLVIAEIGLRLGPEHGGRWIRAEIGPEREPALAALTTAARLREAYAAATEEARIDQGLPPRNVAHRPLPRPSAPLPRRRPRSAAQPQNPERRAAHERE